MALLKAQPFNACARSGGGRGARRRADVAYEAVRSGVGGGFHQLPRKVGLAGGRLDLAAAGQPGEHPQAFAERERAGR